MTGDTVKLAERVVHEVAIYGESTISMIASAFLTSETARKTAVDEAARLRSALVAFPGITANQTQLYSWVFSSKNTALDNAPIASSIVQRLEAAERELDGMRGLLQIVKRLLDRLREGQPFKEAGGHIVRRSVKRALDTRQALAAAKEGPR